MLTIFNYLARSLFVDIGKLDDLIILAGMGRSGTTWAGDIINHDNTYSVLFEPFLPGNVKEAGGFEYLQYINPNCSNTTLTNQAKIILGGKVRRNNWVHRDNNRLLYRRRIIKEIRCNLMLGWLNKVANNPPIILMIRHPLQVVHSWSKLGWGKELYGNRSEFDIITSQKALLNDFPIIRDVIERIDPQDFVENIVFQWCIYHLVPSRHLKHNEAYGLYYETLLADTDNEVVRLFHYLNRPFNQHKLHKVMRIPSKTDFLNRCIYNNQSQLLNGWKDEFSTKQIQRANYILTAFGLDGLYDKNGYPTGAQLFRD